MAAERRLAVIEAMNLPQLVQNKAELSAELRVEVTRAKKYDPSLSGFFNRVGDAMKSGAGAVESLWRGKSIDYDATKASDVLAGADDVWSKDAQELAAALAATNARIEKFRQEASKKEELAAVQSVRAAQSDQPTTAEQYYNKLVQIYNDSELPGKGKPASNDPAEVARAKQWMQEQKQFIDSIPIEMRQQIVQYGMQSNRWQGDFK